MLKFPSAAFVKDQTHNLSIFSVGFKHFDEMSCYLKLLLFVAMYRMWFTGLFWGLFVLKLLNLTVLLDTLTRRCTVCLFVHNKGLNSQLTARFITATEFLLIYNTDIIRTWMQIVFFLTADINTITYSCIIWITIILL